MSAVGKDVRLPRAAGTSIGQVIDEQYVKASGASFAAPILSAAVLEYLSAGRERVVRTFEGSAREIPDTPREGAGVLDLEAAFDRAGGTEPPDAPGRETTLEVVDTESGDVIVLDADWLPEGTYRVEVDGRTLTALEDGE